MGLGEFGDFHLLGMLRGASELGGAVQVSMCATNGMETNWAHSFVRSLSMDKWSDQQLAKMKVHGARGAQ